MKKSALAGAGAGALGAATAIAALLIGSATGHAAPGPSEAYGAFITGIIDPPQPLVTSTDGTTKTSNLVELPENPLLAAEIAEISAGDSAASVHLVNVDVVPGADVPPELQEILDQIAEGLAPICDQDPPVEQLPPELGDLIPPEIGDQLDPAKLCEGLEGGMPALVSLDAVKVSCVGDTGSVQVLGLSLFGQEIPLPEQLNEEHEIPLGPLGSITFNKQEATDKGYTVQGVAINLADQAQIVLASATCGKATTPPPVDKPTATKPAPVTTGLPVTG